MSFLKQLKRRNVFKVSIACVIVAWLVAQVLQLVLESFGAPGWAMKTVLILLATGGLGLIRTEQLNNLPGPGRLPGQF